MSKRLLIAALLILNVEGCAFAPPVPDIEIGLVDVKHLKHHIYMVPKERGDDAKHLRSEPLTLEKLNKQYTLHPSQYSILEGYISEVEDWGREHCR